MENASRSSVRIASATNITVGGTGSHVQIWGVVVGTGVAGSLTLQETNSSGATIATINTANPISLNFWGRRCKDGVYIVNSATGDCTIIYS